MKILFLTLILIAIAMVLLGVKALFVKGGKFSSAHAHELPALRRQAQARKARLQKQKNHKN